MMDWLHDPSNNRAMAWIVTMLFLVTALVLFAAETVIAAGGQKSDERPDEGS